MEEYIKKLKEENELAKESRNFYMERGMEQGASILMLNEQNKINYNNKLIELAELLTKEKG